MSLLQRFEWIIVNSRMISGISFRLEMLDYRKNISSMNSVPTARAVGWLDDTLGKPLVLQLVLVLLQADTRLAPDSLYGA